MNSPSPYSHIQIVVYAMIELHFSFIQKILFIDKMRSNYVERTL